MTLVPALASRIAAARPLPIPAPAAPPPITTATFPLSPQSSGTSFPEAIGLESTGGKEARAVVHHLRGQVLRAADATLYPLLVRHAAHGLDDGLESPPLAPGSGVTERGERHVHDAGAEAGKLLGP